MSMHPKAYEMFVSKLEQIVNMMDELSEIWKNNEDELKDLLQSVDSYPFEASFDEVAFDIGTWHVDLADCMKEMEEESKESYESSEGEEDLVQGHEM
jgi:Zn-dependent M32 family carboxypeptidase